MTKRYFFNYFESILRFFDKAKHLPVGKREWKRETVLLGNRDDKDAFRYFERLLKLYPNSKSYIFEEEGSHHMPFLFPEKYILILNRYLH